MFVCVWAAVESLRSWEVSGLGLRVSNSWKVQHLCCHGIYIYYMYIYIYNMPGLDSERVPLSVNRLLE